MVGMSQRPIGPTGQELENQQKPLIIFMSTFIIQPHDRMNSMQPWDMTYKRPYKNMHDVS